MTASIVYQGDLRCSAKHLQSGTTIETDAPTDNQGKGEKFSPTDMLCVALGTCIITTMAIKAKELNIELAGTTIYITKHMLSNPRRVGQVDIAIDFPNTLLPEEKDKTILERTGNNCPVAKSLSADVKVEVKYNWK